MARTKRMTMSIFRTGGINAVGRTAGSHVTAVSVKLVARFFGYITFLVVSVTKKGGCL